MSFPKLCLVSCHRIDTIKTAGSQRKKTSIFLGMLFGCFNLSYGEGIKRWLCQGMVGHSQDTVVSDG